VAAAIRRSVERAETEKPVLAAVLSAEGTPAVLLEPGSPLATFPYPESAAMALGLAARRAEWLRRPAGVVPTLDDVDAGAARALAREALASEEAIWLDADRTRELLSAYGLPLVPQRLAETAADAGAAASELGFPVVVKSAGPGAHKTETGGVALGLEDEEQVRAAVERMGPPVLVQPMIRGGVELLAGIVQDPLFGPLVAFGPGGVLAELIGDAGFRSAPLTDVDALELVRAGKAGRLVAGFRGAAPVDEAALTDLLHRLSRLAEDLPEVAELDLNPVIAHPDGCVAVDARLRLQHPERVAVPKTW